MTLPLLNSLFISFLNLVIPLINKIFISLHNNLFIFLLSNLFIPFLSLFISLLHAKNIHDKRSLKEHMCKFKKIIWPTQSRSLQQRMTLAKIRRKKNYLHIRINKQPARPTTLLKKRPWHWCFPLNFVKFLRTPFYIEHLWWLLLNLHHTGSL